MGSVVGVSGTISPVLNSAFFLLAFVLGEISCSLPILADIVGDIDFVSDCEIIFVNLNTVAEEPSSLLSSGVFTVALNFTETLPGNGGFRRDADIHRFTDNRCSITFINASYCDNRLSSHLFKMLTPGWQPLVRKDQDYFVFISEDYASLEVILLSEQFGMKILFKTGILLDSRQSQQIFQVDIYPVNGAVPELVAINLPQRPPAISLFPPDVTQFNRKQFRVAIPKTPHYFEIQKDSKAVGGWRLERGLYKKWLDVTRERFNFTVYPFLSSAGGSTGKPLKNGTWVGSIGEVLSGNADMAAFNGHIANRHKLVHWSSPVTYECLIFIVHKPRPFFSASSIYRPFPLILWIGLVTSVGVLVMTLIIMIRPPRNSRVQLAAYFYLSIMEQGAHHLLGNSFTSPQIRVVLSSWLLFVVVISTCYKGKLVGLIAFPEMSWVPRTFDELAYSDLFNIALNIFGRGGATYGVLSTSKSPVYQTFFQRMKIIPDSVSCLEQALHEDIGCLIVRSVAEFYGVKNFSDASGNTPFQRSEQTALFREAGYIWEKHAIFRKHFDRVTRSMQECGLTSHWFQQDLKAVKQKRLNWEKTLPGNHFIHSRHSNKGPAKLRRAHLVGLFYVCTSGFSLSVTFFILEKVYWYRIRRQLLWEADLHGVTIVKMQKF